MEKPKYYGILPAKVRYDERLKPMEKIIYVELTALAHKKGYCHASNLYFAALYGVHKNTVSIWINDLVKYGYITTKCVINNGKIDERRIYLVDIDEEEFFQDSLERVNNQKKEIKEGIVLEKALAEEESIEDFEENIVEELFGESKSQELIVEKEFEIEKQKEVVRKEKTLEELGGRREKLLRDLFSEEFIEEMERKKYEEIRETEGKKVIEQNIVEEESLTIEKVSTKKFIGDNLMVGVSTKKWGGYQLKECYPINKKVEDNNTSIILQDKILQEGIDYINLESG